MHARRHIPTANKNGNNVRKGFGRWRATEKIGRLVVASRSRRYSAYQVRDSAIVCTRPERVTFAAGLLAKALAGNHAKSSIVEKPVRRNRPATRDIEGVVAHGCLDAEGDRTPRHTASARTAVLPTTSRQKANSRRAPIYGRQPATATATLFRCTRCCPTSSHGHGLSGLPAARSG